MGWSRGSEIAGDIWDLVRAHLPVKVRKQVALKLINIMEAHDCDTIGECEDLVKDAGLEDEYYGDEEDDEDSD